MQQYQETHYVFCQTLKSKLLKMEEIDYHLEVNVEYVMLKNIWRIIIHENADIGNQSQRKTLFSLLGNPAFFMLYNAA